MPRVVVTGANGALGRVLIERALARPGVEVLALVRSARAEAQLARCTGPRCQLRRVGWSDAEGLREACAGAQGVIHLAGVLIPTRAESYDSANVETARAIAAAAARAGARKLVLVSAVGADAGSRNAYYRSKGQAEARVREAGVPYTIVRCPLLLACDSLGAHVLARQSERPLVLLVDGGANLEQPADARDVADAALNAALDVDCARGAALDLVGPESLPRRDLLARCARLRGRSPRVIPVPSAALRLWCELRERWLGPGFSADVLEVLIDDVHLDP
ncbi:MAG TPA: NAD(P)H-binding protein, partial [Myxococcota bacterium]|nr:NAD(P)H-binding protein [Myxococcota bacterium]